MPFHTLIFITLPVHVPVCLMIFCTYLKNLKKKEGKDSIETVMSLIEFPLLDQTSSNSVISTTPNDLSNWSRLSCLWPPSILYGTCCCFIEFASGSPHPRCRAAPRASRTHLWRGSGGLAWPSPWRHKAPGRRCPPGS